MNRVELRAWHWTCVLLIGCLAIPSTALAQKPKVEEGKKTVNGVELYYKAIGTGETIIVLHGGPGLDHTELLPQYEQLAKEFRLLFYDQRACGKSGGSLDEKSINVETYVEDLDGIRKAFGIDKANILGFSWGGLLGLFYAMKHPKGVGKLILVNSAPASAADFEDFGKVLAKRRSDGEKKQLAEIRGSAEYLRGDPKAVTASLRLGFRAYCADPDRAKDITLDFTAKSGKAFIEVGNLFDKTLFEPGFDIHAKLKAINCPTLVVHGDTDPIQPKFLKIVSEEIKGSRFVLLDKCGHFSHVEQPTKLFDEITRFMRASKALAAVKEFFAQFGKGDIPATLNTLSVDVDWLIPGPAIIPYAGARKGRKQVGEFFASFNKAVEVQKFEPREFITDGDTVVVLGHEVLKVKSTGKVVDNEWAMVFRVKEGSISKFRSYEDTAGLAAAFRTDARREGEESPSSK